MTLSSCLAKIKNMNRLLFHVKGNYILEGDESGETQIDRQNGEEEKKKM